MLRIKKYFIYLKNGYDFEFYEQNYLEKVYLKLNLAQSTEQEISATLIILIFC